MSHLSTGQRDPVQGDFPSASVWPESLLSLGGDCDPSETKLPSPMSTGAFVLPPSWLLEFLIGCRSVFCPPGLLCHPGELCCGSCSRTRKGNWRNSSPEAFPGLSGDLDQVGHKSLISRANLPFKFLFEISQNREGKP